ncbi:MAG: UDP-4-amino-4,6-dideoxy-N-acetyl-beta-L-altrosamine transaminase [Ilumatobacteraceae bacterium]
MTIPYGRQSISSSDIEAVNEILRSDFLTQGPAVPKFEAALGSRCGAKFAVAVNSATSALHVACMALGVQPGDRVWTSPITFVASANCARYCGADVEFVDIDPRTYNMCPSRLETRLVAAQQAGTLPKVVIPVHLAGQSCDMAAIHGLAKKYGFSIIEDASHAVGGTYKGDPVGNCRFSDITVFSFHPVKIITTGEGGMALTNDKLLANTMSRLRTHGITRNAAEMQSIPEGPWYYEQLDLGYNYRLTDIAAALGMSQYQRIDEFVSRRHEIANTYNDMFANTSITRPWQHPDSYSAFHLYIVRVNFASRNTTQKDVFDELRAKGILANLHYIPVYHQPYYQQFGYSSADYPESESYYREAISLPMYPDLSADEQSFVARALLAAIGETSEN